LRQGRHHRDQLERQQVQQVQQGQDYVCVVPKDLESGSFYGNEAVLFLNEDLKRLLEKTDADFWKVVKGNQSLHVALDSYLRYASRPHDLRAKASNQNIHASEKELSRRVFMVFYRLTLPKIELTQEQDHLHQHQHQLHEHQHQKKKEKERGDVLYNEWIVDIPKIFDICAVYGHSNPEIVSAFVRNAFELQPRYKEDLVACIRTLTSSTDQVVQTILTSEEDFGDLMDHLLYLVDAMSTLCCFLTAYGDYSILFSGGGGGEDGEMDANHVMEFLLHTYVVSFPRVLLQMDIEGTEIAESFRKTGNKMELVLMASVKYCLRACSSKQASACLVKLFSFIGKLESEPNGRKLLGALETKHNLSEHLVRAIEEGHLSMSKGQAVNMDSALGSCLQVKNLFVKLLYPDKSEKQAGGSRGEPKVDVFLEKQVETVRAILPDYGRGFIAACLKHYKMNLELTVSHVMEGSLPYELATLDSTQDIIMPAEGEKETVAAAADDDGDDDDMETPVIPLEPLSKGLEGADDKGFNFYKKRDKQVESEFLEEVDVVVRNKILNTHLYEDDYDDSMDFVDNTGQHEIDDLEGMESGQAGGSGSLPQSKTKTFWVQDGKVYNYAKPGSTKVDAPNAPNALEKARQLELEQDRLARKQAREDKLVKDPPKQQQRPNSSFHHKRKEKKKAHIGNHNRKARALRKQGM